ncbi:MAG: DMT family transporter [Burkholderiaceae bacterium]
MKHRNAIVLMVLAASMWSIGGLVSRHLESSEGLEITFWRSVFASLTVLVWFGLRRRISRSTRPFAALTQGGVAVWISGLMWAVMFTCFMVALSLTRVANVLIMQSLAPVFTALLAWGVLGKRVGGRTWLAIFLASGGIVTMYAFDVSGMAGRHVVGVLVALGIPVAAAVNWVVLQHSGQDIDISVAVLVGGVLSALACLPFAWPLQISGHDMALLALLGVVQLGIPCVLVMHVARRLAAPEMALLALLEVVFGILLAWGFGGERPGLATVLGGSTVLAALVFNELSRPAAAAAESVVA